MRRDVELEAKVVAKFAALESVLDERGRRLWAAAESLSIGYGGDAIVSDATGISRPTIRAGRRELATGGYERERVRAYSGEVDHLFRSKSISDSGGADHRVVA